MIDFKVARLRSKMQAYRRMIDQANKIIDDGLLACPDAYVACSFGKDSLVMLDLVMRVNPAVQAGFIKWQESDLMYNFSEVEQKWAERGANIHTLHMTRTSLDERVDDRFEQLANISAAHGSFVGLRAEESKGRRMTLRSNGVVYKSKKGFWRICPLAWWSTEDIAAYVYENDLPMLDIYKTDGFEQRTASRVPRNDYFIRQEMLQKLRMRDPLSFQKLEQLYPEVSEYV